MTTTRLQRLAKRLWDGSEILAREVFEATAAWVRKGRRDDLSGTAAVLGCVLRALLALLGLYLLWRLIRAFPNVLWLIVPVWCWQALRATRPAEPEKKPAAKEGKSDPRADLIRWLDKLTQGSSGIHLQDLHQRLAKHPTLAHLTRAEIRPWLERHGITIDRTLRVGPVAGRSGVARATVEALLKTLPPLVESDPSPGMESASDLRKSPDSPGGERGGEDDSTPTETVSSPTFERAAS